MQHSMSAPSSDCGPTPCSSTLLVLLLLLLLLLLPSLALVCVVWCLLIGRSCFDPQGGIATAVQHHGKEMSYNNYLDADAAYSCCCDFKVSLLHSTSLISVLCIPPDYVEHDVCCVAWLLL
jgi:hypothetical protein